MAKANKVAVEIRAAVATEKAGPAATTNETTAPVTKAVVISVDKVAPVAVEDGVAPVAVEDIAPVVVADASESSVAMGEHGDGDDINTYVKDRLISVEADNNHMRQQLKKDSKRETTLKVDIDQVKDQAREKSRMMQLFRRLEKETDNQDTELKARRQHEEAMHLQLWNASHTARRDQGALDWSKRSLDASEHQNAGLSRLLKNRTAKIQMIAAQLEANKKTLIATTASLRVARERIHEDDTVSQKAQAEHEHSTAVKEQVEQRTAVAERAMKFEHDQVDRAHQTLDQMRKELAIERTALALAPARAEALNGSIRQLIGNIRDGSASQTHDAQRFKHIAGIAQKLMQKATMIKKRAHEDDEIRERAQAYGRHAEADLGKVRVVENKLRGAVPYLQAKAARNARQIEKMKVEAKLAHQKQDAAQALYQKEEAKFRELQQQYVGATTGANALDSIGNTDGATSDALATMADANAATQKVDHGAAGTASADDSGSDEEDGV